ncbi:CHASE2 domain-containing protein, partial [Bacteroidota bacterium]
VIVEINQDTYDGLPDENRGWPWPRFLYAKLIDNLTAAGVRAIGIDILMSNPDQYSPENDSLMMESIRKSGKVVVAAKIDIEREAIAEQMENYSLTSQSNKGGGLIVRKDENYGNIFYKADNSIGIVQIASDADGVHRRYRPYSFSMVNDKYIPSFGFAILNKYYGLPSDSKAEVKEDYFILADHKIPKFDHGSMLINFYGKSRSFPYFSFLDIIDDKDFKTQAEIDYETELNSWDDPDFGYLQSGIFKDKIVLVGSSMPEDKDILPVSLAGGDREGDNTLYGVEVHATTIQNILRNDFIEKQSESSETFFIFALTIFSVIGSFIKKIKVKQSSVLEIINLLVTLILVVAIYEFSFYLFTSHNFVVTIVSPVLAVVFGYFSSTAYHFIKEKRQNVVIKGMFSKFVSSALVNELIADPEKLKLGGEKKNLSILFSDIAGFTTFSEGKEPEVLVSFMNNFLHEMTDLVLASKGTLDKYLGDAIMAFWGAPVPIENHAILACKTALAMEKRLAELRDEWIAKGEKPLSIRIGVNSGDVVVGNIGGLERFDYTVMGDAVNLASRLEGANKTYKTCIMIGEATYNDVEDKVIVRELDQIQVKGKTVATRVYELIGLKGDEAAQKKHDEFELYYRGLTEYKKQNFSKAATLFAEALNLNEDDYTSKVYFDRCEFYIENPPPKDWNGVFVMKTK